jgi:hypothetical protein
MCVHAVTRMMIPCQTAISRRERSGDIGCLAAGRGQFDQRVDAAKAQTSTTAE